VPNPNHTAKYPAPASATASPGRLSPLEAATRWYNSNIGQLEGSIMAIIIACHISKNIPAAPHAV
jgi:hypothetical protein